MRGLLLQLAPSKVPFVQNTYTYIHLFVPIGYYKDKKDGSELTKAYEQSV